MPFAAPAAAMFTEMVDFPTPPLVAATVITFMQHLHLYLNNNNPQHPTTTSAVVNERYISHNKTMSTKIMHNKLKQRKTMCIIRSDTQTALNKIQPT
jgi:hypothetical protein